MCSCRGTRPRCFDCFPIGSPPKFTDYTSPYEDYQNEIRQEMLDKKVMEGRKDDAGKLRYDLFPGHPLEELARVYTIGAAKYGDHNWRKGVGWGRIFAALCRHAFAWWRGERYDPVDGQEHLASVAWCAFTLMEYEKYGLGEDDRWRHKDDVVS